MDEETISEVMREMGRRGGQVTGVAKGFAAATPEQRAENAKRAAEARWGKQRAAKKKAAKKAGKGRK